LELNDQLRQRRANFEELQRLGVDVYPHVYERTHTVAELTAAYGGRTHDELEADHVQTKTAGRILAIRSFGKANFLVISDGRDKIQIYIRKDSLAERDFAMFKLLDFGDFVGVEGRLFRTRTNELTIWASKLEFLAKCFIPLPEKWHGLQDVEIRYRQRYLDLIVNPDSRKVFQVRSRVLASVRRFLNERGYLEVETPMMQPIAGGALARPFVTHHNALDVDMYLRIAPELYLKRLVVGGFERVYEINRNFRNEGLSTRHNPEFTMLECYQAYADYADFMDMVERMFKGLCDAVLGRRALSYQGTAIDFDPPFRRVTIEELLLEHNAGLDPLSLRDGTYLRRVLDDRGIPHAASDGPGKLQVALFDKTCEPALVQPTFVHAYPTEVSPLSRCNEQDPFVTDRFEFFIAGRELANGFSELNDPEEQAARFREQVARKDAGDEEAMYFDADYVRALEYGLPPTAGLGVGVDRVVMLYADAPSIRDVLLFPQLKPEA
jgi:lysyl-tRNA synthetase class 2